MRPLAPLGPTAYASGLGAFARVRRTVQRPPRGQWDAMSGPGGSSCFTSRAVGSRDSMNISIKIQKARRMADPVTSRPDIWPRRRTAVLHVHGLALTNVTAERTALREPQRAAAQVPFARLCSGPLHMPARNSTLHPHQVFAQYFVHLVDRDARKPIEPVAVLGHCSREGEVQHAP